MSPRLSIIPAGAVTDHALEPRDLQVLCLLGRHTDNLGWCRRSQVKMSGELNCSRSTVQRSLDRLCEAGWVGKKQQGAGASEGAHPSASYAYRVILDRDDDAADGALQSMHSGKRGFDDPQDETCPPVGTPEGAQPDGHPGAQPYVGTGAHTYMGTKNDPLERPPIKRERDARAREVDDFLKKFRAKWPTVAVDDQQRLFYAANALTAEEHQQALDGIDRFLAKVKQLKRTAVIASWKYIEEKRWTLLEQEPEAPKSAFVLVDPKAPEGKAVLTACTVARAVKPFAIGDGRLSYRGEVTPQLLALAEAPARENWQCITDRQQLGAWGKFIERYVTTSRPPLTEQGKAGPCLMVPWPWPPRVDGTLTPDTENAEGDAI